MILCKSSDCCKNANQTHGKITTTERSDQSEEGFIQFGFVESFDSCDVGWDDCDGQNHKNDRFSYGCVTGLIVNISILIYF